MKNESKESARLYVANFIILKKGPDVIESETGISRGTLYQIIQGRNGASRKTSERLAAHYSDFDLNKALGLSDDTVTNEQVVNPPAELIELRLLIKNLRSEVSLLKKSLDKANLEIKEWQDAYRSLAEVRMGIDREGSKIGSSSQTTAWAEVAQQVEGRNDWQVDGLVRYDKAEDSTPVIPLNPFTPVVRPMPVQNQA
jgi:hypothetical protein